MPLSVITNAANPYLCELIHSGTIAPFVNVSQGQMANSQQIVPGNPSYPVNRTDEIANRLDTSF